MRPMPIDLFAVQMLLAAMLGQHGWRCTWFYAHDFAAGDLGSWAQPNHEAKCLSDGKRDISAPTSETTAKAVVTLMPSMRVRSTPHILNSWARKSNLGALRGMLFFLLFPGSHHAFAGTATAAQSLVTFCQLGADKVE